ncbi:MAG: DsbA family protein [Ginsengibacter sp.]
MILPEEPVAIGATARYVESAYKRVEEVTGIKFGEDYLWHIKHPDASDWFPNSEKPAIALCVFKDYYPDNQVSFAADLQYALHFEGRDLTDDEAYRLLLDKYNIPAEEFYEKLHDEEYKEQAYYEFEVCRHLNVTGFPAVFIQLSDSKFYKVAEGYTDYETLNERIENVFK